MHLGRREFTKAAALAAAGLGAGVAAGVAFADTGDLRAERVGMRVAGLHGAHDGLRVAQLSDVHVGPFTADDRIRAAIAAANAFDPDLVVLTGDYATAEHSSASDVSALLGGLRPPVVAVLGNHDHEVGARGVSSALEGLGYAVLRNRHLVLPLRGEPFTVIGIDDRSTRHADPGRALAGAGPGSRLCLAHDPVTAELLDGADAPLVLSGHTHGAQLNVLPGLSLLEHLRYKAGAYRVGSVNLYVNRGVGNILVPLRINAPPEVTLLTLHAESSARRPSGSKG